MERYEAVLVPEVQRAVRWYGNYYLPALTGLTGLPSRPEQ
jgi:hypothetical protein